MEPKPTIFEFTSYKFEPEKKRIFFNYKQEFAGKEPLIFTETIILPEMPGFKAYSSRIVGQTFAGLASCYWHKLL